MGPVRDNTTILTYGFDKKDNDDIKKIVGNSKLYDTEIWQDIIATNYTLALINPDHLQNEALEALKEYFSESYPFSEAVILTKYCEKLVNVIGITTNTTLLQNKDRAKSEILIYFERAGHSKTQ